MNNRRAYGRYTTPVTMPSFTKTWVRVCWLLCAVCLLLPGVGAVGSSSSTTDPGGGARVSAESHQLSLLHIWRSASDAIHGRHRIPNDLTATALRYADSADTDSESGERATACSLLALLRISPHTPCLEDAGARVDRGTLASRIFPFVSRLAPRPPPPPRLL